jgi:hypothetical protein
LTARLRAVISSGHFPILNEYLGYEAMIKESFARLRTHRNNVQRYRKLLETRLTDHERQFIQRRLSEEQSAIEALSAMTLPLIFKDPTSAQDPSAA